MNELITEVLSRHRPAENPYFVALDDGTFTKDDFVETQIQFYFAVIFFSRPMAAVAAKIPEAERRIEIVRNVWEEHGEGNVSFAHGTTFLELLGRLGGVSADEVERRALWPEVRAFNTALVGAAVLDEHLVSVGMMGIIERMFVEISARLGHAIVRRGWLERERMVHYVLHEELDVKHAEDFFAVLRPTWDAREGDRYYIEQGIRLGAYVFDRLYRDLYEARARRAFVEERGRHTRAS
jgi:pyrroloquinoline-quinone synthase